MKGTKMLTIQEKAALDKDHKDLMRSMRMADMRRAINSKKAAEQKKADQTDALAKQKHEIALVKARLEGIRHGQALATKVVDSTTPAPILKETKHLVRKIATNTYEPSRRALQQVFDAEYERALKGSAS